jgi:hypothetical protein
MHIRAKVRTYVCMHVCTYVCVYVEDNVFAINYTGKLDISLYSHEQ